VITLDNISRHEFIGLKTHILDSPNQQIIGLNGTITHETKSMFRLNTKKGIKLIPKARTIWKFSLNEEQLILNGSKIQKRPFDRIGGKP